MRSVRIGDNPDIIQILDYFRMDGNSPGTCKSASANYHLRCGADGIQSVHARIPKYAVRIVSSGLPRVFVLPPKLHISDRTSCRLHRCEAFRAIAGVWSASARSWIMALRLQQVLEPHRKVQSPSSVDRL